ncbi:MAG: potassium channel protein, partial [Bacteroidales bacterium]|nr:potassium channel protein [Bacteroidales bacterium]
HMASLVTKPDVIEFLEHLSIHGDEPTNLEEVLCSYIPDNKTNKTINDLEIRLKTGANIIGYKTPKGKFILNPDPDTKVIPGSKFFVLGTREQVEKMKELLKEPLKG